MEQRLLRDIGEAIRLARLDHGLTEAELAQRIGVGRRTVSDMELGRPGADLAIILAALESMGLALKIVESSSHLQDAS